MCDSMGGKKKITVLLLDKHFFATWISPDVIAKLSRRFELTYAVPVGSGLPYEKIPTNVTIYEFSRSAFTHAQMIQFNLNWVGKRSKSPSFSFWLQRTILGNEYWNLRSISFLIGKLRSIAGIMVNNPTLFLAFIPPIRYLLASVLKGFEYFTNSTIDYIPEGTNIILIPSQGGAEWDVPEVIRNANRANLISILAIDNWDNLTSKQVLQFKPTFTTVMGQNAVEQAIKIHGLSKESILPIGLPRFDYYRSVRETQPSPVVFRDTFKIIYLGFSIPYNETQIINRLVKDLKTLNSPQVEIHYRPHPFRKTRLKESVIDSSVTVSIVDKDGKSLTSLPDPRSYGKDMADFDLIIATPTTMALEVMALGKPCVIDAIDDGIHRTSAGNAFSNYLHMKDLEKITGLVIARKYEDLLNCVVQNYNQPQKRIDYDLKNIMNLKEETYVEQLMMNLSDIV